MNPPLRPSSARRLLLRQRAISAPKETAASRQPLRRQWLLIGGLMAALWAPLPLAGGPLDHPAAAQAGGGAAANAEILAIVRTLPGTTETEGMRKLRPDLPALKMIFRDPGEAERYDKYLTEKLAKDDPGARPFPQTPAIAGVVATPIDLSPDSAAKFREGLSLYKVEIAGPSITLAGFVKANGRWYWLPK